MPHNLIYAGIDIVATKCTSSRHHHPVYARPLTDIFSYSVRQLSPGRVSSLPSPLATICCWLKMLTIHGKAEHAQLLEIHCESRAEDRGALRLAYSVGPRRDDRIRDARTGYHGS